MKNLSSRLLQLPQELKNQIYTYLISDKCIHVEAIKNGRSSGRCVLYPCRATVTSSAAQQIFNAATNIDTVWEVAKEPGESYFDTEEEAQDDIDEETEDETDNDTDSDIDSGSSTSNFVCVDPHRRCYDHSTLKIPKSCMTTRKQRIPPIRTLESPPRTMQTARKYTPSLAIRGNNPYTREIWRESRETMHLPLHLLLTCRQMYHEMTYVMYSPITFSFQKPDLLSQFASVGPGEKALAIRRLHLHLTIPDELAEREWNTALKTLVQSFPNLSSLDISIDQAIWNGISTPLFYGPRKTPSSMYKRNTFLTGMSELKKLKALREFTLVVSDVYPWQVWEPSRFLWVDKDKRDWVRVVRADILGGGKGGVGKA